MRQPYCRRAIDLDPAYACAYYGRGVANKKLGNTQEAIADFERFLELSDDAYWQEQAEQQLATLRNE